VRLLELEPGNFADDIVCHLQPASLDDHPTCVAFSYAPDESSTLMPISCNGIRVKAKQEIFALLRSVRLPAEGHLYWVDELCINQSDFQERNHQVRIMKDIWRRASLVAAYVGEETEDTPAAMEILK
ncbi:hypothetical protein K432DRAFT_256377, partial [Lepidopterella palustris CBS 459.81]